MHLETVSEFKVMQSKKNIGYTYFRFEKNAHKELVDRPVAAFNINGAYLLIPLSKSKTKSRVITDEMINGRLSEVASSIRSVLEVKTNPPARSVDELQMDQEMELECEGSEKNVKMSGRSKPPSVRCGIRLSRQTRAGTGLPKHPVLTCTRRDSPFQRHPRLDARRVSASRAALAPKGSIVSLLRAGRTVSVPLP